MAFVLPTINEFLTMVIIFTSYLFILITILRMRSTKGRHKAFSTCASHLTAIFVFHGTILFIYCRPSVGNSPDADKVATVFYSLRNKDVKDALKKMRRSKSYSEEPLS
jgi:olfactory receptor